MNNKKGFDEQEYRKSNPLKIRITVDKIDRGYHIQAWHNGIVLTAYVSENKQPNERFLKSVEEFSDALLTEVVQQN